MWVQLLELLSSAETSPRCLTPFPVHVIKVYCLVREVHIQKKKINLDWRFSLTPFRHQHEMFLFRIFFNHSAVRARAQSSNSVGVQSSRIVPRVRPGAAQCSQILYKLSDAPTSPGKAQAAESLTCRHRV